MHNHNVLIYTTLFCPYCTRAISLLKQKNARIKEIKAGTSSKLRAQMSEHANGARSFPQIFINGKHIGGCDELIALEQKGALEHMLLPAPTAKTQNA